MLRLAGRIAPLTLIFGCVGAFPATPFVGGQEVDPGALSARVWLDQGEEPVLQSGDRVRVYYRTSADAYVAILQVNTDGFARIVHPASPEENGFTRGGRDYRLLLPQSPYWYVDDAPGSGYYFIIASPEPLDFSAFPYSFSEGGWDLSLVGQHIYTDPYIAIDDFVAILMPQWETLDYALDFLTYHVGDVHAYPRFLCYECHGYQPYYAWNPYLYSCSSFRLVIWDDPYYYPAYRYAGTTVVWTRPPVPGQYSRFAFKERADGEPGTPQVVRRGVEPPSGTRGPTERVAPSRGSGNRIPVPIDPNVTPVREGLPPGGRVGPIGGSRAGRSSPGAGGGTTTGTGEGRGVQPLTKTGGEGIAGSVGAGAAARPVPQSPSRGTGTGTGTGLSTSNGGRSGVGQTPARTGGSGDRAPARPSERIRSTTSGSASRNGATVRSGATGSGPTRVQARPTSGSTGRSTGSARSTPTVNTRTRGSATGSSARPTVRPRPSGGSSPRPAVRPKTGGGAPTRPAVKPKGGGGSPPRPAVKPKGGGGAPPRPAVKPKGGIGF